MVMVVDVGDPAPPKAGLVAPNQTVKAWFPSRSTSSLIVTTIHASKTDPIPKLNIGEVAEKSVPSTEKQNTMQDTVNVTLHIFA